MCVCISMYVYLFFLSIIYSSIIYLCIYNALNEMSFKKNISPIGKGPINDQNQIVYAGVR